MAKIKIRDSAGTGYKSLDALLGTYEEPIDVNKLGPGKVELVFESPASDAFRYMYFYLEKISGDWLLRSISTRNDHSALTLTVTGVKADLDSKGAFVDLLKGNDRIEGNSYQDVIAGQGGNDLLIGNAGDDRLNGGSGDDDLMCGSGADMAKGGSGNDIVNGGIGNDDLRGNGGADCFVFSKGDGDDIIRDFQLGVDTIEIVKGASNMSDLDISRHGSDTVISFADVSITLEDVKPGQLDADDFIF